MIQLWIEEGQTYSVIMRDDDKGLLVMCGPGTQRWVPWEEAKRMVESDPEENGLVTFTYAKPDWIKAKTPE